MNPKMRKEILGALGGELGRPLNSQCDMLLDGSR